MDWWGQIIVGVSLGLASLVRPIAGDLVFFRRRKDWYPDLLAVARLSMLVAFFGLVGVVVAATLVGSILVRGSLFVAWGLVLVMTIRTWATWWRVSGRADDWRRAHGEDPTPPELGPCLTLATEDVARARAGWAASRWRRRCRVWRAALSLRLRRFGQRLPGSGEGRHGRYES